MMSPRNVNRDATIRIVGECEQSGYKRGREERSMAVYRNPTMDWHLLEVYVCVCVCAW
jgi:hypothetical protein